jgi:hypothetical protein
MDYDTDSRSRFHVVVDATAEPGDLVEALATFALAVVNTRVTATSTEPSGDEPVIFSFAEGRSIG